jgi:O-antigen ligase
VFLFRRDVHQKPDVTGALWIPLCWMLILGSRAITEWLELFGLSLGGGSLEEGSPVDAMAYFALIAAGCFVLKKRRAKLGVLVRHNRWLTFFLLYCFISIAWSDFPLVAFKRWIKIVGHPIMVLIVLTEPDAKQALTILLKRCAYVLIPVSILFIKYYPQWGRGFSEWTGEAFNTGVTMNKNLLGCDCLVFGYFFCWHSLNTWRLPKSKARRNELLLCGAFLCMIWWLLRMANSSTSLMAMLVGVVAMGLLGMRWVDKRIVGVYVLAGIVVFICADTFLNLSSNVIKLLGKESTLTGRTELWQDVLKVDINPVLGAGFETFWLGERRENLWEKHWWRPNQAHNGYIETYLNLGWLGVFMLIGLIITTFRKASSGLISEFGLNRFRLGFLAAIVVYNWTEASFKGLHLVYFVFFLIAIDYPSRQTNGQVLPSVRTRSEPGRSLEPVTV